MELLLEIVINALLKALLFQLFAHYLIYCTASRVEKVEVFIFLINYTPDFDKSYIFPN